MKFPCRLTYQADRRWLACCESQEVGTVQVTADSKEEALSKMQGELRYRLELCPCSGETYRHLTIELVQSS